jgi:hypothetical protein
MKFKIANGSFFYNLTSKRSISFFRAGIFVLSLNLFISCTAPVEIKGLFTFETSLRPGSNARSSFADEMNNILLDGAKKAGKDSVLQFKAQENEGALPLYGDLAFVPIFSAEALNSIIADPMQDNFGINKSGFSEKVSAIDFDKNFVLIVGHPAPSMGVLTEAATANHALYFDKILDKGSGNKIRKIELSTKRLGAAPGGLSSFMQKWKSNIYVLQKKDCDSAVVEIDEMVYPFSIKNK